MVSEQSVKAQLKHIGFNQHAWGRAELQQLPEVLIPDEEIFECVNGTYEGGFALLVATDIRVLLIDKKPFNFLTVEDLRFDMINEIDYNHRLLGGAYVDISTGSRDLKFRSFNQPRLRKLIGHVQHCMAESKKKQVDHQEDQNQHLEQINERLQSYLMVQHQHQEKLERQLREAQQGDGAANGPETPRPSPELSDYLLAQGLLAQHQSQTGQVSDPAGVTDVAAADDSQPDDLYAEGVKEVFGNRAPEQESGGTHSYFDLNPLRIAYSKLPMALRNRRFGRPSLHAHSKSKAAEPTVQPQVT